jgi:hypothetical protein
MNTNFVEELYITSSERSSQQGGLDGREQRRNQGFEAILGVAVQRRIAIS